MSWRKYQKTQIFLHSHREKTSKVDKDGKRDIVTISYKIKFDDSARCKDFGREVSMRI